MTHKPRWPNNLSDAEFGLRIAPLNTRFMGAILGLGLKAASSTVENAEGWFRGVVHPSASSRGEEATPEAEATEAA